MTTAESSRMPADRDPGAGAALPRPPAGTGRPPPHRTPGRGRPVDHVLPERGHAIGHGLAHVGRLGLDPSTRSRSVRAWSRVAPWTNITTATSTMNTMMIPNPARILFRTRVSFSQPASLVTSRLVGGDRRRRRPPRWSTVTTPSSRATTPGHQLGAGASAAGVRRPSAPPRPLPHVQQVRAIHQQAYQASAVVVPDHHQATGPAGRRAAQEAYAQVQDRDHVPSHAGDAQHLGMAKGRRLMGGVRTISRTSSTQSAEARRSELEDQKLPPRSLPRSMRAPAAAMRVQQLVRRPRLAQVGVGAGLQRRRPVHLLALRGDHHHGRRRRPARSAAGE
jgi:hypothetical protein